MPRENIQRNVRHDELEKGGALFWVEDRNEGRDTSILQLKFCLIQNFLQYFPVL